MAPDPNPDEAQPRILRTYTTLHQLRQDWGGALILSLGLDHRGAALSIAASIAGAVCLTIDNDPAHLREATRTGAVDFTVNTLDEALRAMKNELRKHTSLAVALSADPILTLNEVLERGLAPQLFSTFLPPHPRIAEAATALHSLGASLVDFTEAAEAPSGFQSSQFILTPLLQARRWALQTFIFDTPAALRSFDAEALALLPPEDNFRRRWLEAAPRVLQRQRPPHRTLWLIGQEYATLKHSQD